MNDRPRAALRELLNELALIRSAAAARGFSEDEIATVCRVYAEARLRPRRVAPIRPGPEWGWKDGAWVPLVGDETDAETDMIREEMQMKVSEMQPSKWLGASDIGDEDWTLTIRSLKEEEVGRNETKWVMYFKEAPKGLLLNKVNTKTLAQLLGDETDDWIGRQVTLFTTEVDYQGEQVLGVRIRKKLPPARRPSQQSAGRPAGRPARPVTQAEADMDPDDWETRGERE